MWLRLLFALPTRRPIRIARGLWLQAPWRTSDADIRAAIVAHITKLQRKTSVRRRPETSEVNKTINEGEER